MKVSASTDETVADNTVSDNSTHTGALIINADDWGRNHENTDRTLECIACGTVSSVSAMVFMQDSERAAAIGRERGIDAGLHLNFTTAFSAPGISTHLNKHQERVSKYLNGHRFAQAVFHPGLSNSFKYLVSAQCDEFHHLYGTEPARLDGHHHMHLCSNVLLGGLLPSGTLVRRNFSFQPGEKSSINRLYRNLSDRLLARGHRTADFFFSLPPLQPRSRLERIVSLAQQFVVEVETHPINRDEYRFLTGGAFTRGAEHSPIAQRFTVPATR